MSMFDYLICKYPLPGGPYRVDMWQTKSLDCMMWEFTITENGRLLRQSWSYDIVPEGERPYANSDSPVQRIIGAMVRTDSMVEDVNYHGFVNFYNMTEEGWIEFLAKFTDGNLVEITEIDEE